MPRFLVAALAVLTTATTSFAQGIIAPTAGPINSSMAGASVAAPVDFGGSYWNPAIISGLPRNELLLGSQLLIPSFHWPAPHFPPRVRPVHYGQPIPKCSATAPLGQSWRPVTGVQLCPEA